MRNANLRGNNYTAGRTMRDDSYGRQLWEAQNAPESRESIGGGTLGDWRNQASIPPWWETQVGGKAYGPFHKSGTVEEAPEDYPGLMTLEPGQNYSYMDLVGNKMLNQSEWTDSNPYRRSNPLIQDLSGMAASQVPDESLFTEIGDGNFKWDPWKRNEYGDVTNPLMLYANQDWMKDEYKIQPGIRQTDKVFQFRDFPWMAGGGIASLRRYR
jgi:hypothetical protein